MLLGVRLTLLMGKEKAVPAPLALTEMLSAVEVTQSEDSRSGFQLTFEAGRSSPFDLRDYGLLAEELLRPFTRVVLVIRFNLSPTVLLDGVITQIQLTPSEEPGASTVSVTGEDISRMMDLEEHTDSYPNQAEKERVDSILRNYLKFGILTDTHTPPAPDQSTANQAIRIRNGTDYHYLQTLASNCGFIFYVRPGFVPNQSVAYFGPSGQLDVVAKAFPPSPLSVNMGPQTNVDSINFTYDSLALLQVETNRMDPETNSSTSVSSTPSRTGEPLARTNAKSYQGGVLRKIRADRPQSCSDQPWTSPHERSIPDGLSPEQARAYAQGITDQSSLSAVTASGELDGLRYGAVLNARSTVDLRGVGATFDGSYYVQSVTHSISKGQYKQRFSLKRDGVFPIKPLVQR